MGSPLDFAGLIKGSHFKNSENVAEVVLNLSKAHHRDEPSYFMVQRMRPIILKTCGSIYEKTDISFVEPTAGPPVLAAIVAEIYGNDADGIRKLSNRVEGVFKSTDGLVDIEIMQDEVYDTFEIQIDRSTLRERIKKRTQKMFELGLIDEVSYLEKKYKDRRLPALKAIGVKEVLDYFNGIYNKNSLKEKIITNTSRLAKRQQIFNKTQFPQKISAPVDKLEEIILKVVEEGG